MHSVRDTHWTLSFRVMGRGVSHSRFVNGDEKNLVCRRSWSSYCKVTGTLTAKRGDTFVEFKRCES
mgnify:CR=1 FL=1